MYIQTEETPNPNALKFIVDSKITDDPIAFNSADSAQNSNLALSLFEITGVDSVFFGQNFVTITKTDDFSWSILKPEVIVALADYINLGLPIFNDATIGDHDKIDYDNLTTVEKEIVDLIDTKIRPYLLSDGGDVTYKGFKEGIVYLQLKGACSSCPSSTVTLKNGIENMIMHHIDEVKAVESV